MVVAVEVEASEVKLRNHVHNEWLENARSVDMILKCSLKNIKES